MLATTTRGTGEVIALVHGFTQTAGSLETLAQLLSARHQIITVDLPGHGGSAQIEADLATGALLIAQSAGRASYFGYSMGGRFALHVALARPEVVDRLILVSATAGIEDPAQRAERRAADEALAQRIENEGVEAFVRWWLDQEMFSGLEVSERDLAGRLSNTAAGLVSSLRHAGTGAQHPLWDRIGGLEMPTLVVAGARDAKYSALARRMTEAIGKNAHLLIVPGAGHNVVGEAPAVLATAIREFVGDGAEAQSAIPKASKAP